ncbi:lipoate--protein ligase [Spiroplasma chrysopicola]|uniref:lipoate--protein ligase n=1 Tax=Spiroplasma chrysopicola DF-1 TaxID=1276227 RepID=R4UAC0_9MOLU|nr:lipoate--protein ligase [Spiroplasma chrysopicola]AGM24859.1 lipoate protein ligase A [Spiroplasma chrysopicola DF-1]
MLCFKSNDNDVYFNLALDEYLLKSDLPTPILFLWKNHNTVIVGKNQNTYEEVNQKLANDDHVKVARRASGGGAVYQDDGNLCFSIILDKNSAMAKNYHTILQPIIDVLAKLGLNAQFAGKNDIEIDGKKISGNAQFQYKERLLHHGTFLFNVDLSKMGKYLNVDQSKIISKGIKSIPARVTNIKPLLEQDLSIDDFMDFIMQEFIEQGTVVQAIPDNIITAAHKLAEEKYRTWEWIYGKNPSFVFQNKIRFEGKGTLDVRMNVENSIIKEIKFFGDFLGWEGTEQLEAALVNCKYQIEDINKILEHFDLTKIFGDKFTRSEILETIVHK